jgi:hypothetical protein
MKDFLQHLNIKVIQPEGNDKLRCLCPWCDREEFYVDTITGLWECKHCHSSGNPYQLAEKVTTLNVTDMKILLRAYNIGNKRVSMTNSMEGFTKSNKSSYLWPCLRPCGAKTRLGTPCKNWALKNRNRCKFHGGLSTGPKTQQGIEAIRQAHLKHGKYVSVIAKRKFLLLHTRLWLRKYGTPAPKGLVLHYWETLKKMTWREFCQERSRFMQYYRQVSKNGKIALRRRKN